MCFYRFILVRSPLLREHVDRSALTFDKGTWDPLYRSWSVIPDGQRQGDEEVALMNSARNTSTNQLTHSPSCAYSTTKEADSMISSICGSCRFSTFILNASRVAASIVDDILPSSDGRYLVSAEEAKRK